MREPRTRRRARVIAVFNKRGRVAMIATDARSHRAAGVQVRDRRKGRAIQLKRAGILMFSAGRLEILDLSGLSDLVGQIMEDDEDTGRRGNRLVA